MSQRQHQRAQSRNDTFVEKTATRLWGETPCKDNPYIAESALCHGYDLYELMDQCSFVEVFYLLFRGELPSKAESQQLETLMIALINPGPRHPATRAAMNAGVGKTLPVHILPIAASVMGGHYLGGEAVEQAMQFLRRQHKQCPRQWAQQQLQHPRENDAIAPGFGSRFGGTDIMMHAIAEQLLALDQPGPCLQWGQAFAEALQPHGLGWLATGLAAAVFNDLGFRPKSGGALFQLISSPGLVAHGIELANKPFTAMPFVSDANYVIE